MPGYVHLLIFSVLLLLVLALILHFVEQEKLLAEKLLRGFGRLPVLEKCLIVGLLVAATAIGGSKNDSTNTPPLTGMFWFPQTSQQTAITASETNLGYRVVAEDSAFGFAEPSQGAVTNEAWRLCGGVTSAFRLVPGNWYFPFRETGATGLTVIARGEFHPDIRTHFFPPAFDAPLAFLPLKNQSLLPDGTVSCFWHEQTVSNSLILTWQNALYNRDLNCLTNFQAELFADGSFVYRYPDHTVAYAPVFPFDWDGDGLENSVDPEPLVAGADAHGTNAEWYNTVCSNVISAVDGMDGVVLSPRTEAVNTNAYYFVDVVVEHGPAPIYFAADGLSRLGNPVVIARSGETNRVPLLIGADYSLTSPVPVQVSVPQSVELSMSMIDGQSRHQIIWPVELTYALIGDSFVPSISEHQRLNGSFSWSGGCCMLMTTNALRFACQNCGCRGCRAMVNYKYEGYTLQSPGPVCGCASTSGIQNWESHAETTNGASVTVGFDRKCVIFEDPYSNTPSNHVGRQSTEIVLSVRACGGIHGGTFTLTTSNLSRLELVSGTRPNGTRHLGPYEICEMVSTNRGLRASTNVGDIEVEAVMSEQDTGICASAHTSTTSYRLELHDVYEAPANPTSHNRHVYGVGEKVQFSITPASSEVVFRAVKGDVADMRTQYDTFEGDCAEGVSEVPGSSECVYICPIAASYLPDIVVSNANVVYRPSLSIVEPQLIVTRRAWTESWFWPGEVVQGFLKTENYIGPMHVSFRGIKVAEIPCTNILPRIGWFASTNFTGSLSHDLRADAGWMHLIQDGNYWMTDTAGREVPYTNWCSGRLVWNIPIGWKRLLYDGDNSVRTLDPDYERFEQNDSRPLLVGGCENAYQQIFAIETNGTATVEKFGYRLSRPRYSLYGSIIQLQ